MAERGVVPEHELLLHLQGLEGPVTTAQLREHLRAAGAPVAVVSTIDRLPERQWPSIEEVAAAAGTGRATEGEPGS